MPETKICTQEQRVKVEKRPDEVTQTYDIEYRNVEWFPNRIGRIVYTQNLIGDERLEITFGDQRHGDITRYGDKILIQPDFSNSRIMSHMRHLSTNERLKNIHPKIMQEILAQLSPEAKSFLEKVIEGE